MAELLLDRIHRQIRERARELEPLAREFDRLDAALTAVGGPLDSRSTRPARATKPAAAAKRRPQAPARAGQTSPKRAARGANRAAVLGVLGERPGAGVSELAAASGVARPVLHGLLKTLAERGEVTKQQLPGGSTGYRLAPEPAAE